MWKRLFIVVTLLLIAGIFAGWYFFARESKYFGTSPLRAIPVDAPFFVRIHKIGEFTDKAMKSNCWKSTVKFNYVSSLYGDIVFLDSLLHQNKQGNDLLDAKELYVAKVENSMLYLMEIVGIGEKNGINALIKNFFLSRDISAIMEKYKEASIQKFAWNGKGGAKEVNLTFYMGILMASNHPATLRKAIDQMDQPSLLEDPDFLRVNKNTAENTDLNIYVHHKTFTPLLKELFSDSLKIRNLRPDYAKWTEIDVVQKNNKLIFNAFTKNDSSLVSYQEIFKRQQPLAGSLVGVMPSTTSFFVLQNLSDLRSYFEDYASYLRKSAKMEDYQLLELTVSKELKLNFSQYLMDYWTGEAANLFTNQNLADSSDNHFLLLKVKSGTNDPLVAAMKKWTANQSKIEDLETLDAAKNNIWKVSHENLGKLVGDLYLGDVKTKWATVGNGFILMGSTPGSLKRYMNHLQRGDLLKSCLSYSNFAVGLAKSYNFYMWSMPSLALPFFEPLFRPNILHQMGTAGQNLSKVENTSWQWGYENGLVYNTASLSVNPDANQNQLPFWKYLSKSKKINISAFVSFSKNSGINELLFQDGENNLISIDKDGSERWRVALEGPVMGEFNTIDVRNNGEFQLLFNTSQAIHLINKNGKEMKNFPLKLMSPATNGVAVFDYDNKKDYRFLVACSDQSICNFDKSGKITKGWKPKPTTGMVEFPLHHFRAGNRDYIVFFDHSRTYILDRQGKERVNLRNDFEHSANDIGLNQVNGSPDGMATTDKQGNIRLLRFDGSVKKLVAGKYSAAHYFLAADLNGTGNSDFIIYDKKKLYRFDQSGREIFTIDVPYAVDQLPILKIFGEERLIVLNSNSENRSILVRKDGSFFNSFQNQNTLQSIGCFDERSRVENWITWSSDGIMSNYQMVLK